MPLVGILRNIPHNRIEKLASLYHSCGLTTLEITMNSDNATGIISDLIHSFGGQLNIGAGTVCTEKDLDAALSAGAQFIVTPIINEQVINSCVKTGTPIFPGAYTPSEIYRAWSLGAEMVKVFPATRLGPEYIKEVLAPLNQIQLMPTGGVTIDNMSSFFKAGARAVGLGSNLFPKALIENDQWPEIGRIFKNFADSFLRNKNQE